MIKADQHTHCNFSSDSDASPESMVVGAIEKGITHLCLTDHMDLDYPGTTKEEPLFEFNVADYFTALTPLKEAYRDKLYLGIGIELGLRPGREDLNQQMHKLLTDYSFDFVLGSVHLLDNDDPYYESYWQNRTAKDILSKYFSDMLTSLKEYDNFDSLGHLDYLIRYIPPYCGEKDYIFREHQEVMDEIFKLLISKDKALEINTAGLIKGLPCFHPKLETLKRYLELGGKLISIGSDGHSPDKIATKFKETEELLRSCGISGYYVYKKRIPEYIPF
ncbi:MAG: histidinol-phosphatase HisJ family protein [Lachnospiraceae bacterium]|nr:histidinol-phosphatase HisJ family protein [Lachnospiraceae bacterium]